jgi:hypothetical protein
MRGMQAGHMHVPPKLEQLQDGNANGLASGSTARRRETAVSILTAMATLILVVALGGLTSLAFNLGTSSLPPAIMPPSSVYHPPPVAFGSAESELRSGQELKVAAGINDLGFIAETADPALRSTIISALIGYIRTAAPPMPTRRQSFSYCLASPPRHYPPTISNALLVIASIVVPGDTRQIIELNDLNFAYATFNDLNFRNMDFDDDLLCRVTFYGSDFAGASFRGACLRFVIISDPSHLTSVQLQSAYSLYKAELPPALAASPRIRSMIQEDPALQPS